MKKAPLPYCFPPGKKLFWKPSELAQVLGCTPAYIYWLIQEYGLPHKKALGYIWLPHVEVRRWFRRRGLLHHVEAMRL